MQAAVHGRSAPAETGEEKYGESAAAIIEQLRYGKGVTFNGLERLEGNLGIPLPAASQWELVNERAEWIWPAFEELIRQAAQTEVARTTIPACAF